MPSDLEEAEREITDNPGKTLVYESMDAHGGRDSWYGAGLLQFRWKYNISDRGPEAVIDTTLTVDLETLAVMHTVTGLDVRFGRNAGDTWIAPANASFTPTPKFWSLTPVYFFGVPFVFNDKDARFELLPEVIPFEGNYFSAVEVTFRSTAGDSPDDTYLVLIDPVSKITRGVIYTVASDLVPADGDSPEKLVTLDGLEDFGGILLPTAHRVFPFQEGIIGEQMRSVDISDIAWLPKGSVSLDIPKNAQILE